MRFRGKGGFTLVELLVAIAIVAILATIAFPIFKSRTNGSADGNAQADLKRAAGVVSELYSSSTLQSAEAKGEAKTVNSFASCSTSFKDVEARASDLSWISFSVDPNPALGVPTEIVLSCTETGSEATKISVCNKSSSGHYFCADLSGAAGSTLEEQYSASPGKNCSGAPSITEALSCDQSISETSGWET